MIPRCQAAGPPLNSTSSEASPTLAYILISAHTQSQGALPTSPAQTSMLGLRRPSPHAPPCAALRLPLWARAHAPRQLRVAVHAHPACNQHTRRRRQACALVCGDPHKRWHVYMRACGAALMRNCCTRCAAGRARRGARLSAACRRVPAAGIWGPLAQEPERRRDRALCGSGAQTGAALVKCCGWVVPG